MLGPKSPKHLDVLWVMPAHSTSNPSELQTPPKFCSHDLLQGKIFLHFNRLQPETPSFPPNPSNSVFRLLNIPAMKVDVLLSEKGVEFPLLLRCAAGSL